MSRMGEFAAAHDAHMQWQMELEQRAYEEWAAQLAADPDYANWIDAINARKEFEHEPHCD